MVDTFTLTSRMGGLELRMISNIEAKVFMMAFRHALHSGNQRAFFTGYAMDRLDTLPKWVLVSMVDEISDFKVDELWLEFQNKVYEYTTSRETKEEGRVVA